MRPTTSRTSCVLGRPKALPAHGERCETPARGGESKHGCVRMCVECRTSLSRRVKHAHGGAHNTQRHRPPRERWEEARGGRRPRPTMEDPSPDDAGQKTVRRSRRAGRDEGGSRTLRRSAGGCTKRLGAAARQGPEGPYGRWLVLGSPIGRTTPASRRPHPQRTLHKDRKGGGLFLFTHLTVERCPFLFIYLIVVVLAPLPFLVPFTAPHRRLTARD